MLQGEPLPQSQVSCRMEPFFLELPCIWPHPSCPQPSAVSQFLLMKSILTVKQLVVGIHCGIPDVLSMMSSVHFPVISNIGVRFVPFGFIMYAVSQTYF